MRKEERGRTRAPICNLSIIAALTTDGVIGTDGELPWSLPSDLARFKQLTIGRPVIMGRKTWESLPERFRPLPGRTNIVLTRQLGYEAGGAIVVNSWSVACAIALRENPSEVFVIGGGEIFSIAAPFASKAYLTLVHAPLTGTVWFPPMWHSQQWERADTSFRQHLPGDDHPTTFTEYRRSR